MWNFGFSVYGTAAFFALLLIGFVWVWIFGANIKHHQKSVRIGIKDSAVRQAKHHFPSVLNFTYGATSLSLTYWNFPNRSNRFRFVFPFNAFVSDSVYHVANTMFELALHQIFLKAAKKWLNGYFFFSTVLLSVFSLNISWSLITGCWGIALIFTGLFLIMFLFEIFSLQTMVNVAATDVEQKILSVCFEEARGDVKKYCRYLKLKFLRRFFISFLQPFLELGQLLWLVGKTR